MAKPLLIACGALASDLRAVLAQLGLTDASRDPVPAGAAPQPAGANRPRASASSSRPTTTASARSCSATATAAPAATSTCCSTRSASAPAGCPATTATSSWPDRMCSRRCTRRSPAPSTSPTSSPSTSMRWCGARSGSTAIPSLRDAYFGNYRRVVLLSQTDDPAVEEAGRKAAEMLGLEFEHVHVGREPFAEAVSVSVQRRVA